MTPKLSSASVTIDCSVVSELLTTNGSFLLIF